MSELWRAYGWRNIYTNKWYVGKTKKFLQHRAGKNLSGYRKSTVFNEAIKEYGPDAFEENILGLYLTEEEAMEAERRFIKEKNSIYPNGYNLEGGGRKGKEVHEITKEKMGERERGENHYLYGKHLSEETKKKVSDSRKGQHPSEEARRRMSDSRKGRHWFNDGTRNVFVYECPEGFVEGMLKRRTI